MSIRTTDFDKIASLLNRLNSDTTALKSAKHNQSTVARQQRVITVKITAVNTGSPETYDAKHIVGSGRTVTNWEIHNLLSADPNTTFAVDDYALALINPSGNNFLLSGAGSGSGSGSYLINAGWYV